MKRPAFQFYPGDWQRDANLRRCSHAARGAWIDVLCLMHDAEEYGVLRWPLADIASAAGAPLKLLRELVDKGVLRGSDTQAPEYVFTPTHAGKKGDPVVLIEAGPGPCWYCGRFVKDEYVRQRRGDSTRFSDERQPPKRQPKAEPNGQPNSPPMGGFGGRQGDGPSSASASAYPHESTSNTGSTSGGTLAGRACRLMREAGCTITNPAHPELLAALDAGVTPEALAATVREAVDSGKTAPFAWACKTARGRHQQGVQTIPTTSGAAVVTVPSWQARAVAEVLGADPHDLVQDLPGTVVREPAAAVPGDDRPPEPRRVAGG